MNVAVDAMGGDHAPGVVVQGAVEAFSELGIDITLVGPQDILKNEIHAYPAAKNLRIRHCEEAVGMGEEPLKALRLKKDSSIRVAFDLVKRGQVDAVVSAGNSGATLAAGVLSLGRLEGVERPAIAGLLPGKKGPVVLIDVGANVDSRPAHLFQFGVMAHAFASSCLQVENPRIGLLSIGEENSKGNEQVRQVREMFLRSPLNFVGNVEGGDLLGGKVDIVVCDGFVGNVALKLGESLAATLIGMLTEELKSSFLGRGALLIGEQCFRRFRKKIHSEEYGGAPLLGIKGVGIVCHGGSSARAIRNAIELAAKYVTNRVLEKMTYQLSFLRTELGFR